MGDRVAVLKDGFLQQVDTPQNLYDHPTNVFVAAFIGSPSMNLYAGSVTADPNGGTVTLGSQTVSFGQEVLARFPGLTGYSGQEVVVGIRPEDFEDAAIATDVPQERRIKGTVMLVEALGSELMIHFVLPDAKHVDSGDPDAPEQEIGEGMSNAVARFNPRSTVRADAEVEISVTTDNLHFFDLQTRDRIH